ncbi:MAG: hypothetical protein JKY54_07270 [Flavobacteriales bacterium]|nr:hypothetical protein [Flavobacteriales bacterium]
MANLSGKKNRSGSTKVLVMFSLCLIAIIGFFLTYNYYNQLELYKDGLYKKLNAIAITTALSIDVEEHEYLVQTYINEGDIVTREQDSIYSKLYHYFKNIEVDDSLNSPICTLFRVDSLEGDPHFYYGINSGDGMPDETFRNEYLEHATVLTEQYEIGAIIPSYESENGYWASAFHPFTNSTGEVVGVVKVEEEFTRYVSDLQRQTIWSSLVSLFFSVLMIFFIIRAVRKLLL